MGFDVELLTVFVAFEGEPSDGLIEAIVNDFPALIFVEFMDHLHESSLSIRQIVHFYHFTEDPTLIFMLTVNKHVFFDLIIMDALSIAEVSANKGVEVG